MMGLAKSVKNICTTALSEGDVGSVSYGSIQRELTQLFSYTREDLRPLKSDISAYARSLLVSLCVSIAAFLKRSL